MTTYIYEVLAEGGKKIVQHTYLFEFFLNGDLTNLLN